MMARARQDPSERTIPVSKNLNPSLKYNLPPEPPAVVDLLYFESRRELNPNAPVYALTNLTDRRFQNVNEGLPIDIAII
jgi:hypothetical protein